MNTGAGEESAALLVRDLDTGAGEGAGRGEMVPSDDLLLGSGEGGLPLLEATAAGKHLAAQYDLAQNTPWNRTWKDVTIF
jgi:hypothetical protein